MTTPLLVMFGENDGTVHWHQGVELYKVAPLEGASIASGATTLGAGARGRRAWRALSLGVTVGAAAAIVLQVAGPATVGHLTNFQLVENSSCPKSVRLECLPWG